MAHEIHENDSIAYVGAKPWHGLGKEVSPDDCYSVSACFKHSGLDWEVFQSNLYTSKATPVDARANYRMIDGKQHILGVVGKNYTPLQNVSAFNFFQPWLDKKEVKFETAGSLFNGRKVWVLGRVAMENYSIVKNDEVQPLVLLSNSHDGSSAIRVGFTPVRVVCDNTLSAAIRGGSSRLIRIRHTANMKQNLEVLQSTMNIAKQNFEASVEQYRYLASKCYNQADIKKYVHQLLKVDPTEEISTRMNNIVDDIINRIEYGKNQDIDGVRGTWWAAAMGYNEYINHKFGTSRESRLESLWFGDNASKNDESLNLALQMATAA